MRNTRWVRIAIPTVSTDCEMAFRLATYFAVAGNHVEALHWLRKAIYLGYENYPWIAEIRCTITKISMKFYLIWNGYMKVIKIAGQNFWLTFGIKCPYGFTACCTASAMGKSPDVKSN